MVIRDCYGHVIGSCIHQIVNMVTVEHREARGTLYAIEFAMDLGLTVIHLDGDCLSVIKGLNSESENLSDIGV